MDRRKAARSVVQDTARPAPEAAAPDLTRSISFRLVVLVNFLSRQFFQEIGGAHRITITEWRVMMVLRANPGLSGAEIARLYGIDKMNLSRAVDGLSSKGRLARETDPSDRRRRVLRLTEAGIALHDSIAAQAQERDRVVSAVLAPEQTGELEAALDAMIARARAVFLE